MDPIETQSIFWLRRPKKWKIGKKWVGPYTVLSRTSGNYKIRSQAGKKMVVHNNNLKVSSMPHLKGTIVCPTPECFEVSIEQQPTTGEQEFRVKRVQNARPRNLLQGLNPPVRYDNIVTH